MKVRISKEDWLSNRMVRHEFSNPVFGTYWVVEGFEASGVRGGKYYVCRTDKYWMQRSANPKVDGGSIAWVYEVRNKDWKKVAEIDGYDIELV